jgi:hypothetical protein
MTESREVPVLTPVVHEVPQADTTRLRDLRGYATETLESIADLLLASSYLTPAERASLEYLERELGERAELEVGLDKLAFAS